LFVIVNVGAQSQRGAAGVLDFQMAEVELGFTARQEPHECTAGGEADGKTFPDPPTGTRHQDGNPFEGVHI
jgi:hypothetical protein